EQDLIPGEADLQPDAGDKVGDLEWKLLRVEGSALYFNRILPDAKVLKDKAGYVHTYVWSPRAVAVFMRMKGTSPRVRVNGELLDKASGRFAWRVQLNAGWNRILARSLATRTKGGMWLEPIPEGSSFFQLEMYGGEPEEKYEESGILWTVEPPQAGMASCYHPVIVGDRIYVTSSPAFLVCYDKLTGKRLWTRYNGFEEFITPAERERFPDLFAEIDPKAKRFRELAESFDGSVKERWELEKLHGELSGLLPKADAGKYAYPSGAGRGLQEPGLAAQPVSDGKFIYTWSYLGIAACYDLDGNRKWMTLENEGPQPKHGYELAPMLIDGDFACEMKHWLGFDRETGQLKWKVPGKPSVYHHNGKPQPKGEGTDIIHYDGLGLYKPGLGFFPTSHTTREGNMLWRIDHDASMGYRCTLPEPLTEAPPLPQRGGGVWHMPGDRIYIPGGYNGASLVQANPLFHDGLIYTITLGGVLRVEAQKDGEHVYARLLDLMPITYAYPYPHGSGCCASPTLAGNTIYLFSSNGTTLVVRPGRTYERVARNRIERLLRGRLGGTRPSPPRDPVNDRYPECTVNSPVFDGRRLYYRAERYLYCIGRE
ncbi:MAG TPA: PQQ-binding-like beta-propeller repeat protein, partial [Planctomycetota bacterium]|nr:PQQ-binding-like beta-propeller repeat protein [Planctomycetota bacterium]